MGVGGGSHLGHQVHCRNPAVVSDLRAQCDRGNSRAATKIGEFFASLMWALLGTAVKAAAIGSLSLALLLAVLFAVQSLISQRDDKDP